MPLSECTSGNSRLQIFLLLVLILASTAAVYSRVVQCGYVSYDDAVYVIENDHIKTGFSAESIRWAITTNTDGNWFPLTWLSYMLDVAVAGSSPATFHVSNLLYHLVNSALLFAALHLTTGRIYRCAVVTALFALHPLHVESVAWISERKDLLSALFFFLTIIAYKKYRDHQGFFRYLATLILFACGLMSKPMLVSTPLLLLLLDYWPLKKYPSLLSREFRNLLIEKIPFFALSLASAIITYNVQKHKAVVSFVESSLFTNIKNAALSYVIYLYKTFVPIKLAVIYPFRSDISILTALAAAAFLAAVSAVVIVLRKEKPYLFVGWFWYLISLLPVIGIIRVGKQSLADRYTYLPHIGFFVLFIWAVAEFRLVEKLSFTVKTAVVIAVLSTLSFATWHQVGYWKNSKTLFTHTVNVTDDNWIALGVLGYDYITANELDKALVVLNRSLAINPKNTMALYNMGILQNKLGNRPYALQQFQKVIAIEPDYRLAHYQIGLQLLFNGDTVGALQQHAILDDIDSDLARQLMSSIKIKSNSP